MEGLKEPPHAQFALNVLLCLLTIVCIYYSKYKVLCIHYLECFCIIRFNILLINVDVATSGSMHRSRKQSS